MSHVKKDGRVCSRIFVRFDYDLDVESTDVFGLARKLSGALLLGRVANPSCVVGGKVEERGDKRRRLLGAEWTQAHSRRPIAAVMAAVAFHPRCSYRETVLGRLVQVVDAEVTTVVRNPAVLQQSIVLVAPVSFTITSVIFVSSSHLIFYTFQLPDLKLVAELIEPH